MNSPEQFVDLPGAQLPVFAAGESLPVLTWAFSATDNFLTFRIKSTDCRKPFELAL
jgi:hypothetical protein